MEPIYESTQEGARVLLGLLVAFIVAVWMATWDLSTRHIVLAVVVSVLVISALVFLVKLSFFTPTKPDEEGDEPYC
jgi:hypothetical protein